MKLERLSAAEEELMNVFWDMSKPLSSVDIMGHAKDKTWSGNYIHKMLRDLEAKHFIEMCGAAQYNGRLAKQFKPLISREEYSTFLLERQGLSSKSFAKIALAFVKKDKEKKESDIADEELIKELQEMVDSLKKKED